MKIEVWALEEGDVIVLDWGHAELLKFIRQEDAPTDINPYMTTDVWEVHYRALDIVEEVGLRADKMFEVVEVKG